MNIFIDTTLGHGTGNIFAYLRKAKYATCE